MVSDSLREALAEVRRYRKEQPEVYRLVYGQLDDWESLTEHILRTLDTPPAGD